MNQFAIDISKVRDSARRHMEEGAVAGGYKIDRPEVVKVLNDVLATEIVCTLRYKRHYYMATGIHSEAVKQQFAEHAAEEQQHADMVAERISQLNGAPDFDPQRLAVRSHSDYAKTHDLIGMIKEDLYAERIAIETYTEIIRWLGNDDPTSRRMMEHILKNEEEHADDMENLLAGDMKNPRTMDMKNSHADDMKNSAQRT